MSTDLNSLTGKLVSQAYYNRGMRKIAREKAIEEEKLEMGRIRLERMLNNRPKHLPPPVQQFVVNNDRNDNGNKIAKRTGLKRKTIKQIVKSHPIAIRTGLKRKVDRSVKPKIYINSLNANKVNRRTYLKAVQDKERRDKEWQEMLKKEERMSLFMEKPEKTQ